MMRTRLASGSVLSLLVAMAAGVAWASDLPAPCIHGRLLSQDGQSVPDCTTVTVKSGQATASCRTMDGRFIVALPPATDPVVVTVADCAGHKITSGSVPPKAQPPQTGASPAAPPEPGDLGDIPIRLAAVKAHLDLLVVTGAIKDGAGNPAPDGTEVALGLVRAKLYDSAKSQGGRYTLALSDPFDQSGGFKAGDALVVALRLQGGKTVATKPAAYRLTATDMARLGVCKDVDIVYQGTAGADSTGLAPFSIERVSIDADGTEPDASCVGYGDLDISGDGRYVVFSSPATNLPGGNPRHVRQLYLKDRQSKALTLLSLDKDGHPGNSDAHWPSISADGGLVVYNSARDDLRGVASFAVGLPGPGPVEPLDMFHVADGPPNQGGAGGAWPFLAGSGRFVTFRLEPFGPGNAGGYVYDRSSQAYSRYSVLPDGSTQCDNGQQLARVSDDGRWVAFWASAPGQPTQVYLRDMQSQSTKLISAGDDGRPADGPVGVPAMTPDGRFVAFASRATNLVGGIPANACSIVVVDTQTGKRDNALSLDGQPSDAGIDTGNDTGCGRVSLSASGRFVAFTASCGNPGAQHHPLLPDTYLDEAVYVHDRQSGKNFIVSRSSGDAPPYNVGEGHAYPHISRDGRWVAFGANGKMLPDVKIDRRNVYVARNVFAP